MHFDLNRAPHQIPSPPLTSPSRCSLISENSQNKMFASFADCPFGTYGVECRKTCNCKGGICDRETGTCLTLKFFAKIASKLKSEPQAGKSDGNIEPYKDKLRYLENIKLGTVL